MTKIKYTIIIFFIFFVCSMEIGLSSCDPCCCNNTIGGQKRCYTSGECCRIGMSDEHWDQTGCRDFIVWIEPNRMMFTLGAKTYVILYVKNTGTYTDSYNIGYTITQGNPNSINVDLTSIQQGITLGPSFTQPLYPIITVFTTKDHWDVIFNVTSIGDSSMYRTATLNIMESDYPLSLPEFGVFGLIEIIILVVILYIINCMF